ncbi:MAG TPA: Na/Pi symporter [Polyangiales bacterium]|nr:Na/Pi symporter [Polyangiales bacterium]
METRAPRRQFRTALLWVLTLAVIGYALVDEYVVPAPEAESDDPDDNDADKDKLRIESAKPLELSPGAAVVVIVAGTDAKDPAPLYVEVSKTRAEVLHRTNDQLVVRVPPSLPYGQAKLRLLQGERKSKPWVLTLRALPRSDILRNVIGGLALFVLGLRTVGRSLRAYAGRRIRGALGAMTQGFVRPAALGTLTGFLTQSTTSAAGLLAGLLAARMLRLRAAVIVLIGTQLGASAAAVLLPLFATREALWVVTIGVLWILLAESRVSRALGSVVIGAGLLFLGLGILQSGFAPLVSDPQVLPYLSYFRSGTLLSLLSCVGAGALLTALLQGPSPVFALVMSLAQISGSLGLREALATLAGVSLGALVSTATAAWPFGREARRLVPAHAVLASAMTVTAMIGLPLWTRLSEVLVARNPAQAGFGPNVLVPGMSLYLGVGFLALEVAAAVVAYLTLPFALRLAERNQPVVQASAATLPGGDSLASALSLCRSALSGLREITTTADRGPSAQTERALRQAGATLQQLLDGAGNGADSDARQLRAAAIACIHLTDAISTTLRIAEKAPEHGMLPSGDGERALERVHGIVDEALAMLIDSLAAHVAPSLMHAQAREIELNALETETRHKLFDVPQSAEDLPTRLWSSELCAAYEAVGNQLYRITSALGARDDEL